MGGGGGTLEEMNEDTVRLQCRFGFSFLSQKRKALVDIVSVFCLVEHGAGAQSSANSDADKEL